jgi:hypothetical protein
MAAKFADARRCGATRLNTVTDGPAFQQCMQSRGWGSRPRRGRPLRHLHRSRHRIELLQSGRRIVMRSPQGTVKYTNKYGLSCTRSRMMNICSNL